MPDNDNEPGSVRLTTPPHTPPFRGPAAPAAARPALRPINGMAGRPTVPPFMPPIRRGGPLPGAAAQPRMIVPPYVAPVRTPAATPIVQAAVEDARADAIVTPEHTTSEAATPAQASAEQASAEQTSAEHTTAELSAPEASTAEAVNAERATSERTTSERPTSEHTTLETETLDSAIPEHTTPEATTPEATTPEATTPEATTPERIPPALTTGDDSYVGDEMVALPIADFQPTAEALEVSDEPTGIPVESAIASATGVETEAPLHVDATMLSIDEYAQHTDFAAQDNSTLAADVEPLVVQSAYEPPPPPSLFTEDLQLTANAPVAPAVAATGTPTTASGGAPLSEEEVEGERQALVDAIVGAVVRATDERSAERDDEIDHHAMRLFAADPFEEPFLRVADHGTDSLAPAPFDDDDDITPDLSTRSARALAEASYAAAKSVPPAPWPPPQSTTRPRRATPRVVAATTPVMGVPVVRPAPRRMTPTLSSRVITPMTNPVIAYRPPAAPETVRPPAPVAVSMPTPRSIPAVPDLAGARAVVVALETVAAQIRAGQIVIGGEVPRGADHNSHAACLSVALAALLGVRQ